MADNAVPKKKSKLKWLILLLLLLLIGGGAAGAWFFLLKDKFLPSQDSAAQGEKVEVQAPTPPVGTTVPLPVFTTNLADPLGQRFIRLNVEIEVADAKAVEELARQNAKVRESILLLLSSKTYADIATNESKLMLKSEITNRLNAILGPGKVYQVFITDMVIQ
jgi:flagellar FliL protein